METKLLKKLLDNESVIEKVLCAKCQQGFAQIYIDTVNHVKYTRCTHCFNLKVEGYGI